MSRSVAHELSLAPMFVHVEAAAATACGCETVGVESEGLDSHRWDVGQRGACWPVGSREPPFSAQLARTVGMASSRYHSQKARRAGTSVWWTLEVLVAPVAAQAQE